MRKLFLKNLTFILSSFFILITTFAYSQGDTERASRETDLLGRKEEIQEKLKPPLPQKPEIEKEEIPVKEGEEKFFIKKINLVGFETFPTEDFASIIKKYENREVTLTELNSCAKEVEKEYLKRGIIAAVFVPPQEVKEGVIVLQAVEAKMGELDIQDHKYFRKKRLSYYWKIPPDKILYYDKISKSIQLMNKNPDRQVRAALRAGKKPGTTDIVLVPETNFPIHLTATYDREGIATTGKSRNGLGLRHNNFLGFDDTLIGGYSFGQDFASSYVYHTVPISSYGTSFLYGYSRSESKPKKDFAVYGLMSEVKDTSLSIHQDIYKKDEYQGEVFVGFDAKDKTIKQNTVTSNRDRLRIFNVGSSFVKKGNRSVIYISPEFSQGVDAFGASNKGNPIASRGAKSNFSRFNLKIQYNKVLFDNVQLNYKFKTQFSSTKLTPQEEFSLGGIDSVRGYPAGDFLADNAVSHSAELLFPSFFIPDSWRLPYARESFKSNVTPVVFLDYGWGMRRGALPTEEKDVNFLSTGTGIRVKLFDQIYLRLEWGFPLGDHMVTEAAQSFFHFSVDFQENLPKEIKRIKQEKKKRS